MTVYRKGVPMTNLSLTDIIELSKKFSKAEVKEILHRPLTGEEKTPNYHDSRTVN
jgi:hypothetical protein